MWADEKVQVLMPLVQGMAWTMLVAWWRHWNTATKFGGQTAGARIRRWWWGVNNWKVPNTGRTRPALQNEKLAADMREYYAGHANAGSD